MNKLFLIAEIGQAHHGSLSKAHEYIDAVAETGVDAIKFQTHIAEAESSIYEPFRVNFSNQYETRYDYWKAMEFSLDQWQDLKQHCDDVGLEFMSSPFSNAAVDLLEKVGVKRYKVGSGEVNNFLLLEKLVKTQKPLILSSGMSSLRELDASIHFLKEKNVDVSIMQCTTSYPTMPEQLGLNMIQELKSRYKIKVGFSDHSAKIATSIAAVTLGAEILEFHVVLNRNEEGPDVTSSLTIGETKQMVDYVKDIYVAIQNPIDKDEISNYLDIKQIFEKSLAVNKDLKKGDVITFDDLETKKPKGYGILAEDYEKIIGKQINKPLAKWSFINFDDLI